jgi:hypothetical protein
MGTSSRRQIVGGLLTTLALVVAVLVSGSPGSPASATSNTRPSSGFFTYVEWTKSAYEGLSVSRLGKVPTFNPNGRLQYGPACAAITDSNCKVSALDADVTKYLQTQGELGSFGLSWTSVFPYCESTTQMNCIAALTVKNSTTGATEEARFLRGGIENSTYLPSSPFSGDLSRLIPNGGLTPYFATTLFPEIVPSKLVNAYRVQVSLSGQSRQATCDSPAEKRSAYCKSKTNPWTNFVQQFTMKVESVRMNEGGESAGYPIEGGLPKDAEFSVRVRISTQLLPKGWLSGRVVHPGISQKAITDGFEIEVSGAVAQVPSTVVYLTCSDLMANTTVKRYLNDMWSAMRRNAGLPKVATCADSSTIAETPGVGNKFAPVIKRGILLGSYGNDYSGFSQALDVFKAANDAVGILRSEWSLNWTPEDLPWDHWTTGSVCNSIGLVGVVGSTAALYGEFPIFDPTTGRLTYQMVGPHYLADGTLNTATMSMVMRRDYAMCQWGIDPAPETMLVNIANSNSSAGNQAIISSKVEGDFFRVDASGITFSAPKMGIVAKAGKVKAAKSLFLKSGSSMPITKVVKARKGFVASWYVKKGSCRITARDTKTLRMAKKGSCEILITEFNKKTRTAKRTLLKLS